MIFSVVMMGVTSRVFPARAALHYTRCQLAKREVRRMSHRSRHREHFRRRLKRRAAPGAPPGSLTIDPLAPKPVIHLFAYNSDRFIERDISEPEELRAFVGHWPVCWVDIEGLGDARTLEKIAAIFQLHPLAMEDVVNVHQRAKVDTFGD